MEYAQQHSLAGQSLLLDIISHDGRYYVAGERGHILWSDDGDTWTQAESVPTRATLTSLWGQGDRIWAAGHDSVILFSDDRGLNWQLSYQDIERQQPVMDIRFSDDRNGVAIGAYALMLRTSDGGQTWEDDYVNDEDDYHLNSLVARGDARLIAGEAGYSYRSEDGGATWLSLDMPYPGSMFGAVDTGDCVLFFGLRGHVQMSCDDGLSWQELDSGTESSLSGAVYEDGRVIMVGNSGTILEWSQQAGFTEHTHGSGAVMAAIVSRGDGSYLLVGEQGVQQWPEADGGAGS